MHWIECVERRNGELGLLVSDGSQALLRWHSAAALPKLLPDLAGHYRKQKTCELSSWKESTAREYITVLEGNNSHAPSEGHVVYSFHESGTEYLVPAIVLLKAFFRPFKCLAPWLLHPTSLELVSAPTIEDGTFSASLSLNSIDTRGKKPETLTDFFTWVWAYPSSRLMWNSVYQHALRGKLGITLPQASIRAIFHGVKAQNRVAVTKMTVLQVTALEQALFDTPMVQETFTLHAGMTGTKMVAHNSAEQQLIRSFDSTARPLSDPEWNAVSDVVLPRRPNIYFQHDPRLLLDGILEKLVTGNSWRETNYSVGDWRNASTAYRRWVRLGIWEHICKDLIALNAVQANAPRNDSSPSSHQLRPPTRHS